MPLTNTVPFSQTNINAKLFSLLIENEKHQYDRHQNGVPSNHFDATETKQIFYMYI